MKSLTIEVRVKTRAKERSLVVDSAGTYQISTPAVPEKGRANIAVINILAEHFHTPKQCISIVKGQTTSRKLVKIMAQ